jgi:predicted RecB family nuclease
MKITADLFNAYLDCPTKSWLRGRGETSSGNLYSDWAASQEQVYRREGFNRLLRDIPSADHVIAPTKLLNCRPPKWRMVLDVSVQVFSTESCLLESRIDALERVSSEGSSKRAREMRFVPIRFVFANKVTKKERLLLGFDALVLSQALKREVREGRIIHGDQYTARKIVATALADETQKLILRLEALLASRSPPDLVLNRHCAKCEFQGRCRKQAIEKDELTLLAGMTEKERKKLHSKGIFTVTQLSYTFRPRKMGRHAANKPEKHLHPVKALAIREKKIHLVGNPELRIDGTPVYVDVEGLPDRDFYYLIGVRLGHGDSQVHTLWADSASDERTIWKRFIRVLGTVTNPVLVHYGSYESNFFKRMYERHGGPPTGSDLARSMKSSVNLLSLLSRSVYLPTYSNTLKDTASFFGASWQWSDASGIQAIAQRYEWERTRSQTIKERLLKYNQDDCAALEVLALGVANVLAESKSRPDIDFAYSPKKVETGSGVEIHKTFNSFLRAAHFDYVRGKIKLHTRGDALPVPLIPRLKRRPARRELPSRGGRIIRVPRKRKCPRHPEHPSMLRPCSKDREHAYLDIAFTRTAPKRLSFDIVVNKVGALTAIRPILPLK